MKTCLSKDRVDSILTFAEVTKTIPGVIAEIGVTEGGMVALLAGQCPNKKIYAIDTFAGTPKEKITRGIDIVKAGDFRPENPHQVIATLKAFSNVEIVQGVFPEVMSQIELAFSLVHIDVDIYKSTLDALHYVWPRLSEGGIVILDDWEWEPCCGVQRAAQEYFDNLEIIPTISPATASSPIKQAFIIKPGARHDVIVEKKEKVPSGIVFVTAFDEEMSGPGNIAMSSADKYCRHHGYRLRAFHELPNPNIHKSLNKVQVLLDVMNKEPEGQWVWWFDADILFSDIKQNAFDLISGNYGKLFVFSTDSTGLCSSTFAVCNSKVSRSILNALLVFGDIFDPNEFGDEYKNRHEQNSFKKLIRSFPAIALNVGYMPPEAVNDKPEQDVDPAKQFFLHFTQLDNSARESQMKRRIMWEQLNQCNQ